MKKTSDGTTLTKTDLAAVLNCSMRTLERLLNRGRLPQPIRLGGLLRWPRNTIEEFLNREAEQAAKQVAGNG